MRRRKAVYPVSFSESLWLVRTGKERINNSFRSRCPESNGTSKGIPAGNRYISQGLLEPVTSGLFVPRTNDQKWVVTRGI